MSLESRFFYFLFSCSRDRNKELIDASVRSRVDARVYVVVLTIVGQDFGEYYIGVYREWSSVISQASKKCGEIRRRWFPRRYSSMSRLAFLASQSRCARWTLITLGTINGQFQLIRSSIFKLNKKKINKPLC